MKYAQSLLLISILSASVSIGAISPDAKMIKEEIQVALKEEIRAIIREEIRSALKELREEIRELVRQEVRAFIKTELKDMVKEEVKASLGFINPYEILEKSEEYQDELKKIQKELENRKDQLKSLEEMGLKKKTELETMGATMNEATRERKREELVNLEAQYRIKMQGAQEYAENAEQKARMRILKKIQDEADKLAKEEGRILVLAGGVVSGDKSIDLTEKVLTRLNDTYRTTKPKKKSNVENMDSKVVRKPEAPKAS